MATDSAMLTERPADQSRRAPALRPRSGPIARTVGLDMPFFADKNRAFWVLQSAGWAGYFILRTLSGIANAMGWSYVLHTALLTAAGYSITLLMAAAYRRLIRMRPLVTWVGSVVIVAVAAAVFSVIETWSVATFVQPGIRP